jgi:redox-sensitive bicupin YhaK (pirin superfamily)
MTSPTFGAHPHAGMSALSILFEDSEGVFNNRDSLGNAIDLLPGDAYWLMAGSGAIHDEKPTEGSRTHGLQIFVNLPRRHKHDAPTAKHVPSQAMPTINGEGYKVRVVLGETNGTKGATSPALPLTVLDAYLDAGATYTHEVSRNQAVVIYAVRGYIDINLGDQQIHLPEHRAIALRVGSTNQQLALASSDGSHLVILQGAPIEEPFVQEGPYVMSNRSEIDQIAAAHQAGLLGSIAE